MEAETIYMEITSRERRFIRKKWYWGKRKTDTISHASLGRRHIFSFVASSANHAQNEGPWSGAGRSKRWRLPKWGGAKGTSKGKLRNKERSTYLTACGEPQGDIRGSTVFNVRPAGLRMKEGTLPEKIRKACVVKYITRLFKSGG